MSNLTIAQGLRRIKKLKGELAEHTTRAQAGVSYLSTTVPAFRYTEEKALMQACKNEMVDLESRIAIANATVKVKFNGNEVLLARAIRELQEVKGEIAFLKGLNLRTETIREKEQEYDEDREKFVSRYTEKVFLSDLSEKERDQQVKVLMDKFEQLNNVLEDANHSSLI
jgi:hypothetical protein